MNERAVEASICGWLSGITSAESPPCSVVAFNVGLFASTDGYRAYLVGADHYDPDDEDWACDEQYSSRDRSLVIAGCDASDAWDAVLAVVAGSVRKFLGSSTGQASFLAQATAVTVGFDDGDLVLVSSAAS